MDGGAGRGDARDVERLLASLTGGHARHAVERLERLMRRGADPRVAEAACGWVRAGRYRSMRQDHRWWRLVFEVLAEWMPADTDYLVLSEASLRHPELVASHTLIGLSETVAGLSYAGPPPRPLTQEEGQWMASWVAEVGIEPAPLASGRLDAPSEASLFEAIVADPDADGPRAVLADLLLERDHPRGRFLQLQLARHAEWGPAPPWGRRRGRLHCGDAAVGRTRGNVVRPLVYRHPS